MRDDFKQLKVLQTRASEERERWVCLPQELETSDASCSPNPVGSVMLLPHCVGSGRAVCCSQPCSHRFAAVGLPKDTVLFPTYMGSLDHLQNPTKAWDMAQFHLPSAGANQASVQSQNLPHYTKFHRWYSPLPKSGEPGGDSGCRDVINFPRGKQLSLKITQSQHSGGLKGLLQMDQQRTGAKVWLAKS